MKIDSSKFVFEKTRTGYSAYSPEYPGVGVAAKTREATEQMLREAIEFHLEDEPRPTAAQLLALQRHRAAR